MSPQQALEPIIKRDATVSGPPGGAGFCVRARQSGGRIGRRNHQQARFTDGGQGALSRAGTTGADDANERLVGRQPLPGRLTAFRGALFIGGYQLDSATEQLADAVEDGQLNAALRILAEKGVGAGMRQHGAYRAGFVRQNLNAAQIIAATNLTYCHHDERIRAPYNCKRCSGSPYHGSISCCGRSK